MVNISSNNGTFIRRFFFVINISDYNISSIIIYAKFSFPSFVRDGDRGGGSWQIAPSLSRQRARCPYTPILMILKEMMMQYKQKIDFLN